MKPKTTSGIFRCGFGHGFAVRVQSRRLLITCAHVLPSIPPVQRDWHTFANFAAPFGEVPYVACDLFAADIVADLAVLGTSTPWDQREPYVRLMADAEPFEIGEAEDGEPGWFLALTGKWVACELIAPGHHQRDLGMRFRSSGPVPEKGCSGMPILSADGRRAVGIVGFVRRIDDGTGDIVEMERVGARLSECLPARFLPRAGANVSA